MAPILPDQLQSGLRIVFCGSAAGTMSAMRGAYYAGPGNRFWRILVDIGLTPRLLAPEEFVLLPAFGIGVTDLAKHTYGPDSTIKPGDYDPAGLASRIRACRPALLAFNGKRAAAAFLAVRSDRLAYGDAPPIADFPPIGVLPSTSGAASGHWDASHWHAVAARVRATTPSAAPPAQAHGSSPRAS
jgi:double-stranded uracil-DNA glycosylase